MEACSPKWVGLKLSKTIALKLWIILSFMLTGRRNPEGDIIVRSRSGRKRPSDLGVRLAKEWKNQHQLTEVIYKRWGRKDCPETATLVYHGKEKIRLSTNSLAWVIVQVSFFSSCEYLFIELSSLAAYVRTLQVYVVEAEVVILSNRFREEFSRFICRLLGR